MNQSHNNPVDVDEIPSGIVVISADRIIFPENFSVGQCIVSLLLLLLATAGVLYVHGADFLTSEIMIGAWCALFAFGCGMLLGPLWRRQIAIDLAHNEVIVRRGPLLPLQAKVISLREFDELTVETQRVTVTKESNRDNSRNYYLVGRTYRLIGKTSLTLLNRTFEAKDAEADHLARIIENRLRSALSGRLGKKQ